MNSKVRSERFTETLAFESSGCLGTGYPLRSWRAFFRSIARIQFSLWFILVFAENSARWWMFVWIHAWNVNWAKSHSTWRWKTVQQTLPWHSRRSETVIWHCYGRCRRLEHPGRMGIKSSYDKMLVNFNFGKFKNERHYRKVLLGDFHLNCHTVIFHPQTLKLEPPCTAR